MMPLAFVRFMHADADAAPLDPGAPADSGAGAGAQAGKYGLGLTLCLLYSQVTFGGCMKVKVPGVISA